MVAGGTAKAQKKIEISNREKKSYDCALKFLKERWNTNKFFIGSTEKYKFFLFFKRNQKAKIYSFFSCLTFSSNVVSIKLKKKKGCIGLNVT